MLIFLKACVTNLKLMGHSTPHPRECILQIDPYLPGRSEAADNVEVTNFIQ